MFLQMLLKSAIEIYPEFENKLKIKGADQNLIDIFQEKKFDIIFSNQTLYYLD